MNIKKKGTFSKGIIIITILSILLFTMSYIVVKLKGSGDFSDAMVYSWFSFWGCEVLSLAAVKRSKINKDLTDVANSVKYGNTYMDNTNDDTAVEEVKTEENNEDIDAIG